MKNCNGMCLTGADIGVGSADSVAYPHPTCPEHGDKPDHPYEEKTVHELHTGFMGVCVCGAYKDEHR